MPSSLVVALLLAAAPVAPERVVLVPVTGTNTTDGILAAAQDLLKGHLERTGRFQVVVAPGPAGARPEPTGPEVAEAIRQAGVGRGVALRITRLGSSAHARLSAYDAAGVLGVTDELTAASPDDLDPVLKRLAVALATGHPASSTAELDTVTEHEADALPKMTATHVFGVMLGELVSLRRPAGGTVGIPGFGAFWLYDARELLAEATFDYHGQEDDHVFGLGVGAYYPFLRRNATPYAGGGLRYAWSQFGHTRTSNGMQARAALGLLFGRLSTVQLRAELGYFVNLYRDREYEYYPSGYWDGTTYVSAPATTPRSAVAHGPTLGFGIGF